MLDNIDSLLLNGEVENIETAFYLKSHDLIKRDLQTIKCRDIVICDCKYEPLEAREVLRCYICPEFVFSDDLSLAQVIHIVV